MVNDTLTLCIAEHMGAARAQVQAQVQANVHVRAQA